MAERSAHAHLAVGDCAGLGSEPGVGVEVFERGGVFQHPVVVERFLPQDVDRPGDVTAASRALFLAGELAVAPHVEEPGIAAADGREDLRLRRDDAVARMRNEARGRDLDRAALARTSLGDPLLDPAFHDAYAVVPVAAQRETEPRGMVPALRVVTHHNRLIADPKSLHRARDLVW